MTTSIMPGKSLPKRRKLELKLPLTTRLDDPTRHHSTFSQLQTEEHASKIYNFFLIGLSPKGLEIGVFNRFRSLEISRLNLCLHLGIGSRDCLNSRNKMKILKAIRLINLCLRISVRRKMSKIKEVIPAVKCTSIPLQKAHMPDTSLFQNLYI